MALFSREQTRGFYSELGNSSDVCHYCEQRIINAKAKKEITVDEAISKANELKGKMTNVRIAKIQCFGRTVSICPRCITEIYKEAGFKETVKAKDEPSELFVKQEEVKQDNADNQDTTTKKVKTNAKK